MGMSRLWALIQAYLDSQEQFDGRRAPDRWLAQKVGVPAQTLNQWKVSKPTAPNLRALAKAINRDYLVVKAAADADADELSRAELEQMRPGLRISDADWEILLRNTK